MDCKKHHWQDVPLNGTGKSSQNLKTNTKNRIKMIDLLKFLRLVDMQNFFPMFPSQQEKKIFKTLIGNGIQVQRAPQL